MNSTLRNALITLVILLGTFLGGFYAGKSQKEVRVQDKVVYKDSETKIVFQDRVIYKDRIVTVTKITKPDGTVVERTRTENKDKEQETHQTVAQTTKVSEKETYTTKNSVSSKYSLGIVAARRWNDELLKTPDFGVVAGTKVIGEFWLKATIIPEHKEAILGIEFQF